MTLSLGSTGAAVTILQAALLAAQFDPMGADGVFGPDTQTAVERFQHAHGLTVDGVVGPETTSALKLTAPEVDVPDDAVTLAASFEGFSAAPYWDATGKVWTYGFGSTRDGNGNPVTGTTQPITRIQAVGLMRRDLTGAATVVAGDVRVPLTDDERSALEDLIYNIGEGNFEASSLLRRLNTGDRAGAAELFDQYDHSGGVVLAGLLRRREAEKAEFLKAQPT